MGNYRQVLMKFRKHAKKSMLNLKIISVEVYGYLQDGRRGYRRISSAS
jgi:hypothetical protein